MIIWILYALFQGANEAVGTTAEVIDTNEVINLTDNPIASSESGSVKSIASSVCESAQVEEDLEVFALNPNKIRRTFPLRVAGSDPAQCLNILDSMYEIYYDQEVRILYMIIVLCLDFSTFFEWCYFWKFENIISYNYNYYLYLYRKNMLHNHICIHKMI